MRQIVRGILLEERPPPEAAEDDVYGEYLFGSNRHDVRPEEEDTDEEVDASIMVHDTIVHVPINFLVKVP